MLVILLIITEVVHIQILWLPHRLGYARQEDDILLAVRSDRCRATIWIILGYQSCDGVLQLLAEISLLDRQYNATLNMLHGVSLAVHIGRLC